MMFWCLFCILIFLLFAGEAKVFTALAAVASWYGFFLRSWCGSYQLPLERSCRNKGRMNLELLVRLLGGFVCVFIFLLYIVAAKWDWQVRFWLPSCTLLGKTSPQVITAIPTTVLSLTSDLFYPIPSAVAPNSSRHCSVWQKEPSFSLQFWSEFNLIFLQRCTDSPSAHGGWTGDGRSEKQFKSNLFSNLLYLVCTFCIEPSENHGKPFLSADICSWVWWILQPSLAEELFPVRHCWYWVMELPLPYRRKPGLVSRHQQFIAHFIYFSKAVASVSAKSRTPGDAEVWGSHSTTCSMAAVWAIFKQMRFACGYSKLPGRRRYWNGCSQRDCMSQMLPQVIRQVSVFASTLPINELGCDTKHSWFYEQLWPWLLQCVCTSSVHCDLWELSRSVWVLSLSFVFPTWWLPKTKVAQLFILPEARPLGPERHDFCSCFF